MFDGQGIAHPRGLGIASHLGVVLGLPAIGCAKSRLVGEYEEPGPEKGAWSKLVYGGRPVGAVVRTRAGVKPVFVSPGHRVSLEEAVELALAAAGRYRLPEPLRRAHRVSLRERNLLK
jgi:deoxyribonuclease V